MNRETQSIEKKRHIPLWNTKKVVKKDILLIPAYIFFQSIIPIIVVFGTLGITAMITPCTTCLVLQPFIKYKLCSGTRFSAHAVFCLT